LQRSAESRFRTAFGGPSGNRRPILFLNGQKNAAIPAIRENVNAQITKKIPEFCRF
jgi:hypothetical protein